MNNPLKTVHAAWKEQNRYEIETSFFSSSSVLLCRFLLVGRSPPLQGLTWTAVRTVVRDQRRPEFLTVRRFSQRGRARREGRGLLGSSIRKDGACVMEGIGYVWSRGKGRTHRPREPDGAITLSLQGAGGGGGRKSDSLCGLVSVSEHQSDGSDYSYLIAM
ncbi:hypothetical protein AAFF_G00257750 [Aldrovandia affinis]|uniref:Uncharacterized protein n=1 Tax=Aldrovandia affinis TaxID=143900 RepID=A0AAD7STC1_9TELE|nr:hypothetical protein AAFF_G00257750 [Aldrovandia affinis]